mmetsp:Transcript_15657/g.32493  ORF Transcript_15657/g.32493 Transcript_15657/m.32493 type:complete len:258 (-) Transcript_15657:3864-4637(-)
MVSMVPLFPEDPKVCCRATVTWPVSWLTIRMASLGNGVVPSEDTTIMSEGHATPLPTPVSSRVGAWEGSTAPSSIPGATVVAGVVVVEKTVGYQVGEEVGPKLGDPVGGVIGAPLGATDGLVDGSALHRSSVSHGTTTRHEHELSIVACSALQGCGMVCSTMFESEITRSITASHGSPGASWKQSMVTELSSVTMDRAWPSSSRQSNPSPLPCTDLTPFEWAKARTDSGVALCVQTLVTITVTLLVFMSVIWIMSGL